MQHLRVLLITAALAATACAGSTDTVTQAESATTQPTTSAATSSPPPTDPPSAESAVLETEPVSVEVSAGSVAIEVEVDLESEPIKGTFEVTNGAELLGCGSGSVIEYAGPRGITNELTCIDGTRQGTITLRWTVLDNADGPGELNGPWTVAGATGDFVGLTGEGLWSGDDDGEATALGSFPGEIEFGPIADAAPEDDEAKWERGLDGVVPVGTVRLPELGGIQFELDKEREILQQRRAYTILLIEDGFATRPDEVNLVAPTATSSGAPLTTIDELTTALTNDVGADLVPIGEVDTAIGLAHGFEYSVENYESLNFDVAFLKVGNGGWDSLATGQFWLLDTERGLFMVTAEAVTTGALLDEAIVTAQRVLETIEFADLGAA